LEYSWYSVISPEGCAAILWRDASMAPQAAEALKLTSSDLLELGIIDRIIPEPPGGAHNDPKGMALALKNEILHTLEELEQPTEVLLKNRLAKFRQMGVYREKEG
jgi:acetyl-CoA carboxylase carboxyl transferase subunit alpha